MGRTSMHVAFHSLLIFSEKYIFNRLLIARIVGLVMRAMDMYNSKSMTYKAWAL